MAAGPKAALSCPGPRCGGAKGLGTPGSQQDPSA